MAIDQVASSTAWSARLAGALDAIDALRARLERAESAQREPVAVIGIGCRLPGGVRGPDDFWALLREGRDGITAIPGDRFDQGAWYDPDPAAPAKTHARFGGFVDDLARFDPGFFGLAPREVPSMDPQHRLTLEVAWEALEHAGLAPDRLAGSRTGVFVGLTASDYLQQHAQRVDAAAIDAYLVSGNAPSAAAGRVAYLLGLRGPSLAIDSACSSSLAAIHVACQSLRSRDCDMALAGGVNALIAPEIFVCLSKWGMLAPDGRCKTFDARADGFVRGEGCGMLVLRRLADAVAGGDRILAVIRGSAVNQDGASGGLSVPNGAAQVDVIRRALAAAGVAPAAVDYVEAHGTGTSLGDPIELEALAAAYGAGRPADRPLVVGSVKTNIGHLESAAGVAGLIKTVLALQHGAIPAHLHFEQPTPHVQWDRLPLTVPARGVPWPAGPGPRLAGVSSFGFSGTNVHVVLEAPPPEGPGAVDDPPVDRPRSIVTLSARTAPALRALARRYVHQLGGQLADHVGDHVGNHVGDHVGNDVVDHPGGHPDAALADIAFTANTGRAHLGHRLAWRGADRDALRDDLAAWAAGEPAPGCVAAVFEGDLPPPVGFLFTGQGAQHVGMGRQLYQTQPVFRAALDRCADLLGPHLPEPLLAVVFADPDDPAAVARLDDTRFAQPALFALGFALAEMWRAWGIEPAAVMGHSLGEITAACVAGAFDLEDGVRLVAARASGMGALPRGGAMAAVFAAEDRVRDALRRHGDPAVVVAAVNGPEHVVISGPGEAVAAICARFEAEGARSRQLAVSHAFHSPLVEPMLDAFEHAASAIATATPPVPLISNVTGRALAGGEAIGPAYWRRHARSPVRFADGIAALHARGIRTFVEIGPRPTLIALGQRCLPDGEGVWLPSLRHGRDDWAVILDTLAVLHVRGAAVDWAGFDKPYRRRRVPLPTYPFEGRRYWLAAPGSRPGRGEAAAAEAPHRHDTGHPLLGTAIASPLTDARVFQASLTADRPAFLADHVVGGRVVLPATAYIEQALAAARRLWGGRAAVRDLVIERMLALETVGSRTMQTVVTPRDDDSAQVEVFSLGREDAGRWRRHATARIESVVDGVTPTPAVPPAADARDTLVATQGRCGAEIDVGAHYAHLAACGIALGPRFRGLSRLWVGAGEALGEVVAPAESETDFDAFNIHPALLDACLQVSAAAWPEAAPHAAAGNGYHAATVAAPAAVPDPSLDSVHGPGPDLAPDPVATSMPRPTRGSAGDAFVPIAVEAAHFTRPAGARVWSSAVLRPGGPESGPARTFDLRLFAPDGSVVGEIQGLVIKRVAQWEVAGETPSDWRRWLYVPRWERYSLDRPRGLLASIGPVGQREDGAAGAGADPADIVPRLDRICAAYAAAALGVLGWSMAPGARAAVDALPERLGVIPAKQRLLRRLLAILAEDGLLRREGGDWVVARAPADGVPADQIETLVARHPGCATELRLLARCGERLGDVLAGRCDPLTLLFPEGSADLLEGLYRDSATSRAGNALVGEAVASLVADWPRDRTLRVLEIGAGTGGTTAHVLPRLPAGRTHYVFTDVSPAFLNKARLRLSDQRSFDLRPLDIERDPAGQGFEPGSFDLVLAANVVHATADLRQTLAHVRSLLAPGGRLLLLEVTAERRWIDLTFGLTDGWWRFTDADLRPAHPLMAADRWTGLLAACGFEGAEARPAAPDEATALAAQTVIAARAPLPAAPDLQGAWLILEDAGGVGAALAAAIERGGGRAVRLRARLADTARSSGTSRPAEAPPPGAAGFQPATPTAPQPPDAREVDPTDPQSVERGLAAAQAQAGVSLTGVVHLWSLDAPLGEGAGPGAVAAAQALGSTAALHVVQALIRSNPPRLPRLWLVTRGCQVVDAQRIAVAAEAPGLAHATLWGMARTVALEHPELACTCIDLDPRVATIDGAADLATLLADDGGADQLAVRGQATWAARLTRDRTPAQAVAGGSPVAKVVVADVADVATSALSATAATSATLAPCGTSTTATPAATATLSATPASVSADTATPVDTATPPGAYRLAAATPGVLESLAWRPAERRAPGPGEVELRVQATGLNFRDVLSVLGEYPGDPGPLGGECAGEVVALGPGVTDLEIGEAVIAVGPGAFASHVTTNRALVVRRPDTLPVEAAATALVAYLTAAHALREVARLRPGEHVLIHAAAGGVGLAAVQVARRAGAEVLATAGSAEKQAYLRSLGVPHVFHSRSEAFAAGVLAATGGRGVDVVLNSLADPLIAPSLAALAPEGRFVEIGKRGIWAADRVAALRPAARYEVVDLAAMLAMDPPRVGCLLEGLVAEIEAGDLDPLPYRAFALGEAPIAFRTMARGEHTGKLVLRHPDPVVRADGSYLVTGGYGGLGLLTAEWLAEQGARHLVLVGRRPSPAALQARLARLSASGVDLRAEQADVADEAAMARLLDRMRADLPPLRGVFHAAGVLDDGALPRQDRDRFERVLAPKVQGAWILHRLTRSSPLDHFVLYGSTSAVLGSPGQANHAAANGFLDALAHYRRALGLPALSIDWGAWSDVGSAARGDVADRLAARGIGVIPPAAGMAALADLVARASTHSQGAPAQVVMAPVDWRRFRAAAPAGVARRWFEGLVEDGTAPAGSSARPAPWRSGPVAAPPGQATTGSPPRGAFRANLASAPVGRRRALLVDFVAERARRVIGIDGAEPLDAARPLHALGLDSLMAVEVRNILGADLDLDRPLPASLVFDHPSIDALADHLGALLFPSDAVATPATTLPPTSPAAARAVAGAIVPPAGGDGTADLADLTEEQAAAVLMAELAAHRAEDGRRAAHDA